MRINPASLPVSKLLAGAGALGMLGAVGVFGIQDVQAAPCWSGTKNVTPRLVQPGHFDVQLPYIASAMQIRGHSTDPWKTMWKDVWVRQAAEYEGDQVIGPTDWMSYGGHDYPTLREYEGVLLAYSKTDPEAVGLYGWQNEDNHQYWLYETGAPTELALKNHRALAFSFSGGSLRVLGMDAKSGHESWCRQVKGASGPTGSNIPASSHDALPWFTEQTGDDRNVLFVTRAPRYTASKPVSTVSQIDVNTGKLRWSKDLPGDWQQVIGGDGQVFLVGEQDSKPSLAALRASDGATLWAKSELPTPEDAPSASRITRTRIVGLAGGRLLLATQAAGGSTIDAYDLAGRPQWALPADPAEPGAEALVSGGVIVVPATRSDGRGIGAYRVADAKQLWFAPFATPPSLANSDADGSRVYLPSPHGPVILGLADGVRVPTKLTLPIDVALISNKRLVVEKTLPDPSFDEVVAFQIPEDPDKKKAGPDANGLTDQNPASATGN